MKKILKMSVFAVVFALSMHSSLFSKDENKTEKAVSGSEKKVPEIVKKDELKKQKKVGFHLDFTKSKIKKDVPEGWTYRGKIGTPDVKYELVTDKELKHQVLKIVSDKASGVIMIDGSKVDLEKYPMMRWRWKAVTLPSGADARVKEKDDQGLAVYAGYGRVKQTSVSYNWQTVTPKQTSGHAVYNSLVNVDWFTLRNQEDKMDIWYEEEVNLKDDMVKFFKKIPSDWAISISSNSQYTKSKAEVYLDYIEFVEK